MRTRPAAVAAALALAPLAAAAQPGAALGAVHGVVYDSLGHRPLAGAIVQTVRAGDDGGGRGVTTDSAGAFRIDSLAPGRYVVGFTHPLLDLLRVEVAPRVVDIGPAGGTADVDLALPALATVRPVVCGSAQAATDSSGLVAGVVRDAADGAPVANAKVVLTWSEISFGKGGPRTEHRRAPVTTRPGGTYVLCGVPAGDDLVASADAPGRASGEVALTVPPRGFVVRDLTLGDTASAPRTVGDSAAVRVARGTARLTGTVRDSSDRPVRGGRAFVWGTNAATTIRADGTFTLGELPEGTRTLEVRAIGFVQRQVPVELAAGRATTVDLRMERITNLAPVAILGRGTSSSPLIREFLDRKAHNPFGRFLTAVDIEKRPFRISDSLRGVPGLWIEPNAHWGYTIIGRGGGLSPRCKAVQVLNGMVLQGDQELDDYVDPLSVAGIEVYIDGMHAPPQYSDRFNSCSVVIVWTRQ